MIDVRRWTANEREVVRDALKVADAQLRSKAVHSRSAGLRADVQWRRVVIGQALDAIGDD